MKKALTLMLALILVAALFAGCTNNGGSTEATPTPAASTGTGTGSTGNTSAETEATPEPTEEPYEFKLPLVDTPTTLTAWRSWSNEGLNIGDPAEIACNVWLAEKTGVTIQWEAASGATAAEQFGIMIASNDYCDMIMTNANTYVGGVDKGIADEVYIDLTPYLDIMPNFEAARRLFPDSLKETATDDGNVFLCSLLDGDLFVWNGPMYYKTLADELGYTNGINTYDELHSFLLDAKNQKGIEGGLAVDIRQEKGYYSFCAGFNTTYEFYQENGTVRFGPQNEGFREMLETLAQWYSEGLINQDTLATMEMSTPMTMYGQGKLAYLCNGYYGYANLLPAITGIEGEFLPAPYARKNATDMAHLRYTSSHAQNEYSSFITTAAVERGTDELCAKWLDTRFYKDCAYVIDMGIQGEDWDYNADGEPRYTELYSQKEAEQPKVGFEVADRLISSLDYADRDYITEVSHGSEWLIEACDIYPQTSDAAWCLPRITLNSTEATEYARYYTDISTYVEEFSLSILNGNVKMSDSVWSEFQSKLSSMGIDKCLANQQAALDRYNAR